MSVLDKDALHAAFTKVRARQAMLRVKTISPFDTKVGNSIFQAAYLALSDHRQGRKKFRVVSAPTGSGKTSSALCVASALYSTDPTSSCAFVVDTIRAAEDLYGEALSIFPEGADIAVWTTAHDDKADLDKIEREYGFRPRAAFSRDALATSRVIIVTHNKWLGEMSLMADTDNVSGAVRTYNGKPRSLIFVDEHPSLVTVHSLGPADVLKLRDVLGKTVADRDEEGEDKWDVAQLIQDLELVHANMEAAYQAGKGPRFIPIELIPDTVFFRFALLQHRQPFFRRVVAAGMDAETALSVVKFIIASNCGYSFMSQHNGTKGGIFIAYDWGFKPGPGYVLLDATADITGMIGLVPGMEEVSTPSVDYRNLSIFHLTAPTHIIGPRQKVSQLLKAAKTARPYADWIRATVIANTTPGEKVLVVTHKGLVDHAYIDNAADSKSPANWDGRLINVIYWGTGIGSNAWKDCTAEFLFGEFHKPRRSTVAEYLGIKMVPASSSELRGAQGQNLTGDYLSLSEGNLLRWTKQLASRGNVRNHSEDGVCGTMRLYTSMEFSRLTDNLPRMFPGAGKVQRIDTRRPNQMATKGKAGLIDLLLTSNAKSLSSTDIKTLTGCQITKYPDRFFTDKEVVAAMADRGWRWIRARGQGKQNAFIRLNAPPSLKNTREYGVLKLKLRMNDQVTSSAPVTPT